MIQHTPPSSPLRYPGGKSKIANYIKLIFDFNGLNGHYAEPYAGGAGVALNLLFSEYARKIYINDKSRSIFAFWHSVVHENERLAMAIETATVTMDEWHRQKDIQRNRESADIFELGYSTFFMNRTNRSGIIGGGVIGGLNQSGVWKLDVRFGRQKLAERIRKIGRYKNRIAVTNLDAIDFITDVVPTLPAKSLLNLDPPYYLKGQCVYDNFYNHDDHVAIAAIVTKLAGNWIVTYDNVEAISELYKNFRQTEYGLTYTAGTKQRGTELMIFSENLRVPEVNSISSMPARRAAAIAEENK